jgi:hypothetical protein
MVIEIARMLFLYRLNPLASRVWLNCSKNLQMSGNAKVVGFVTSPVLQNAWPAVLRTLQVLPRLQVHQKQVGVLIAVFALSEAEELLLNIYVGMSSGFIAWFISVIFGNSELADKVVFQ